MTMKKNIFKKTVNLSIDNLLAVSKEEFIEYLTDADDEVGEIISYECVGDNSYGLVSIEVEYKMCQWMFEDFLFCQWMFEDFLTDKHNLDWNEYGQLIVDETQNVNNKGEIK